MMANEESSRITVDDFESSRLLHEIEEISKALYLHDAPQQPSIQGKYVTDDLLLNGKKSSIWKWKPLKALTHIRNHRVSCSFFLHIHSIEGLPLNFNNLNLCVYWKRKHEVLKSQYIRVKEGVAKFEETLIHRCSVGISKHDPHDNVAMYTPKLSLLYASIVGAPTLDIGKHWVDLTRLLPLTLTELEDENNRYGKWLTSFELTGKAKGAIINVSFGFSLTGHKLKKLGSLGKGKFQNGMLQRVPSKRGTHMSNMSLDVNPHATILPYEGPSNGVLYEFLDDAKTSHSKERNSVSSEVYDDEFGVVDKGIEFPKSLENSCIETIEVADLFGDDVTETVFDDIDRKESNTIYPEPEEYDEELELFLQNLSISEKPNLDVTFHENQFLENDYDLKNEAFFGEGKMVKSRSLDDLTNTVVHDLMNLVGFDGEPEPESPREQLLKQFEKETLASGNFVFDLDVNADQSNQFNPFSSSFLLQKTEIEPDGPALISRRKAKMLENLETETLMEKWGLNERAFQNSPRTDSGAFGSPIYLSPEKNDEPPSLGDGLGPFLKNENGGFLRSMNPLVFKSAKNGEKLVMQVSNTVVLSPAMGTNGIGILVNLASLGPEKMFSHVTRLMPLEVITGKTLQQAAWKAESQIAVLERGDALLHRPETISEYVSLSNVIPSTIEKIQHLLIEGLIVQSGLSTEEPPSTIKSTSTNTNEIEELIQTSLTFETIDEKCAYFGNFTLALQILLRDPLRDYEPVGIPMLAFLHLERSENVDQMVKVNEVLVAGLKANLQKRQQSGYRWLHSSGMMTGKARRYSLSKSTALVKPSIQPMNKMKHEETLWSISKESRGLDLYVRNPDIIFD